MNVRESVSHEQAVELLPWLVNDSLDAQEKEAVLEHAHACVICRRELRNLQQIRDSIAETSIALPVPEPDMRSINARIDALVNRQNWWRGQLSRLGDVFDRPWRMAFAAQTVVVLVLAAILLWPQSEVAEFTTLTQPANLPDGHYVRVVFSPDLNQSRLSTLLDEFELTIVEGPSDRGVYTLAVSEPAEYSEVMLSSLQDDPNILFVQPVTIGAER